MLVENRGNVYSTPLSNLMVRRAATNDYFETISWLFVDRLID